MNVIIDLHAFSHHLTGKHHYTLNLIHRLATHPKAKSFHFHLVSTSKFNLTLNQKTSWHIFPKTTFYPQLSLLTRQLPNSILLSPTSFIPPTISFSPTITIIYDLAAWQKDSFAKNTKATLLEKTLYPTVIKKSSHLITISHATKKELLTKSPQLKTKLSVIHPQPRSFPDTEFKLLNQYQLKKNHYILFVGTIEPRKNLLNLLHAYHQHIQTQKHPPQLVLAGSKGWHHQHTFNTINQLNLNKHVTFINSPTDAQLAALYQHCIFLAYLPHYEGFGLPILEAISFNKPILTSTTSSLPEAAGKCGLLADPQNISDISQALTQLTQHPTLRKKLSSYSSSQLKAFSSTKSVNQLINIVKAL